MWALAAQRYEPLRTRALWWFTVFVEFAIFVQVALGVGMVAGQKHRGAAVPHVLRVRRHHRRRHRLLLPAVRWVRQHVYLLYGGGGLFLMGLGIRAMLVGQT